jgi:signal peptidase II
VNTEALSKVNTDYLKWLWLSLAVIFLDHISKIWAIQLLDIHKPVPVIPFFNLYLAHNAGAAFSFLQDAGGWQRWFFSGIAVFLTIVLLRWMLRLPKQAHWSAAAIAAIIGGALGNLWDRLDHAYVIDFLQLYYQKWYFPTFNIADIAISLGAAIIVIRALKGENNL